MVKLLFHNLHLQRCGKTTDENNIRSSRTEHGKGGGSTADETLFFFHRNFSYLKYGMFMYSPWSTASNILISNTQHNAQGRKWHLFTRSQISTTDKFYNHLYVTMTNR